MPWPTGDSFRKHNKKLHGHAADVAAAAATAVLKKTGNEAEAVRIGNAAGDKAMKKKKFSPTSLYKD